MRQTPCLEADASPELLDEYRQWQALGQGGVSRSWEGFMFNKHMAETIAREETTDVRLYDSPETSAPSWDDATEAQRRAAQTSFIAEKLPARAGPRARAKPFVLPQRERNEGESRDENIRAVYKAAVDRLGTVNTGLEWKTSGLERYGPALFLQDNLHPISPLTAKTRGEICHVHQSDFSAHVTLSLADAKEVVQNGWGERHRLSGTEVLPLGYTLLYVPRHIDEIEILIRILQAGVDYMKTA